MMTSEIGFFFFLRDWGGGRGGKEMINNFIISILISINFFWQRRRCIK